MICPTCGGTKYEYQDVFKFFWYQARQLFPLVALPEPDGCLDCMRFARRLPVSSEHVYKMLNFRPRAEVLSTLSARARKEWLRSTTPIASLDKNSPETRAALRKGARTLRSYEKLIVKQREQRRKLDVKRQLRKIKREMKPRKRAIQEVLDRALEIALEDGHSETSH